MSYRETITKLPNGQQSLDQDDEDSFVVLSRSLLPEKNGTANDHHNNIESISNNSVITGANSHLNKSISKNTASSNMGSSSFTSVPQMPSLSMISSGKSDMASSFFASSLSPEEIQKKLNDLLQENIRLKETVHQNNLAMKQQFTTLSTWQEKVMEVQTSHKQKFEETKKLIATLKAENNALKKAKSSTHVAELEAENGALRKRIEVLESMLEEANKTVGKKDGPKSNDTSFVKVDRTMEAQLDELVDQLTKQLALVERSRREEAIAHQLALDEAKSDMSIIREQLRATQVQLTQQKQRKESLKSASLDIEESTDTNSLLKHNAEFYNTHIKKLAAFFDKQKNRHAILHNSFELAIVMLSKGAPQFELLNLRDRLSDEFAGDQEDVDVFIQAQNHFQKIFKDYQHITQNLETLQKDLDSTVTALAVAKNEAILSKNEVATLKKESSLNAEHIVEISKLNSRIQNLHTVINAKDEDIEHKMHEIAKLNEAIAKLKIDNESIGILTAQIELYQSDFNAERQSRQSVQMEKDRLAEDLRLLQRRNQQLLEQLEKSKSNPLLEVATAPGANRVQISPPRQQSSTERYECPRCNFAFFSYQAVVNHVERCLDLDMLP